MCVVRYGTYSCGPAVVHTEWFIRNRCGIGVGLMMDLLYLDRAVHGAALMVILLVGSTTLYYGQ